MNSNVGMKQNASASNMPKIVTVTERVHAYATTNNMEQIPYHLVRACYLQDLKNGRITA
jgi:hypothetical protein